MTHVYPHDHIINAALDELGTRSKIEELVTNTSGVRAAEQDGRDIQTRIADILADCGGLYFTTVDQLRELWITKIRSEESNAFSDWILHASAMWRAKTFAGAAEYQDWVNHLASSMCSNSSMYPRSAQSGVYSGRVENLQELNPDYVAIDDEYMERLPRRDYIELLQNNLWFCFLMTLYLGYDNYIANYATKRHLSVMP